VIVLSIKYKLCIIKNNKYINFEVYRAEPVSN